MKSKPRQWPPQRLRDEVNFLLTNRIPRIALTRLMGRFSAIENPWLAGASIGLWRAFSDLDLSEARQQRFRSLQACFTRELKPGTRPFAAATNVLASPCDGLIGACGPVGEGQIFQAKGMPYAMADLFGSDRESGRFLGGTYATLRLTATMYHRFHAPHDAVLHHVTYVSGDAWNVNPPALARVQQLFCRNERAVLRLHLANSGHEVALVPVAAVLVASIRLHALDVRLHLRWPGPNAWDCHAAVAKGDELGWFEHGSTLIVFAPPGFSLAPGIATGNRIRAGQPLMHLPD